MTQHTDIPLGRSEPDRDDLEGVCPECRRADGSYHVGRARWLVCTEHMVRWLASDVVFDPKEQVVTNGDDAAQHVRSSTFNAFREVAPHFHPLPVLPGEIVEALNAILDQLWTDQAAHYAAAPVERREGHLFRHMHVLDCWMSGRPPKVKA